MLEAAVAPRLAGGLEDALHLVQIEKQKSSATR
jgi:hypothetical protein